MHVCQAVCGVSVYVCGCVTLFGGALIHLWSFLGMERATRMGDPPISYTHTYT